MEIKTSWQITDDTADSWNQTLTKETDNQKKWVAVGDLKQLIKENIGNVDFTITLQDELNKGCIENE